MQGKLKEIERRQACNAARLEREVCATFARGNISLQQGNYITSQDMDAVQKDLAEYFLKDRKK